MWYRFPAPIILGVTGKDSQRYLNARLSNDCKSLQPGSAVEAAALNAQGRIEGHFLVFCRALSDYLLLCEGGDVTAVRQAFTRYIVADRVSVTDESQNLNWFHVADFSAPNSQQYLTPTFSSIVISDARLSPSGMTVVVSAVHQERSVKWLQEYHGEEMSSCRYHYQRAHFGTPSFPEEMNEGVLLTECQRTSVVSFSKGCYVGQEVVERSDAIGRVPRLLARVKFPAFAQLTAGAKVVTSSGDDIGRVVSSYSDEDDLDRMSFCLLRNGRFQRGDEVFVEESPGIIV